MPSARRRAGTTCAAFKARSSSSARARAYASRVANPARRASDMSAGAPSVRCMRARSGMPASWPPRPRISSSGCAAISAVGAAAEEPDRLPVAVKGSHIDVGFSGLDARGLAALRQPGVDQSTDIFIAAAACAPEVMKLMIDAPRHAEGAPDPTRGRMARFDIDSRYAPALVGDHGIEELRMIDGEEKERQPVIGQRAQGIRRKPDRVRQSDHHL